MAWHFLAWYSRRMARGGAVWAVGLVVSSLLSARDASAQARPSRPKVPLALEYVAPGNCPGPREFRAMIEARTDLAVFADDPNGAEVVHVTIRATGSSYAGHLFMAPLAGATSDRDVEDLHCTDVADALALVTALAIDQDAALLPSAPPPPPVPAPPEIPPRIEPPATVVVTPNPSPPPQTVPDVRLLFPSPGNEPRARIARAPLAWHWNAGADGVVESGLAPDVMLGGAVFGELAATGEGVFVPSVRASLSIAANGAFEPRKAVVTLVDARLTGCPLRFGNDRFSLGPCGAAELGDLLVEGDGVATPLSAGAPWVALDALGRLHWQPARYPLFLEAEGGPTFPLTRPTFVYDLPARVTAFRASSVAPVVSIGVGLRFQ